MTCGWGLCSSTQAKQSGYSQVLQYGEKSAISQSHERKSSLCLALDGTAFDNISSHKSMALNSIHVKVFKFPFVLQTLGQHKEKVKCSVTFEYISQAHQIPDFLIEYLGQADRQIPTFLAESLINIQTIDISGTNNPKDLLECGKIIGLFILNYLPNKLSGTDFAGNIRLWIIYNFKIVIDKLKNKCKDTPQLGSIIDGLKQSLDQYLNSTFFGYTPAENQLLQEIFPNSPTPTR